MKLNLNHIIVSIHIEEPHIEIPENNLC